MFSYLLVKLKVFMNLWFLKLLACIRFEEELKQRDMISYNEANINGYPLQASYELWARVQDAREELCDVSSRKGSLRCKCPNGMQCGTCKLYLDPLVHDRLPYKVHEIQWAWWFQERFLQVAVRGIWGRRLLTKFLLVEYCIKSFLVLLPQQRIQFHYIDDSY